MGDELVVDAISTGEKVSSRMRAVQVDQLWGATWTCDVEGGTDFGWYCVVSRTQGRNEYDRLL